MWNRLFQGLLGLFLLTLFACTTTQVETEIESEQAVYSPELAAELGADDYGMRSYVFATLLTGPNDASITDAEKRNELFKGHFSNMARLAKEGKLVLAGPFIEGGEKRGLFIFNVATIEEAEELVKTDPSIAAGIFKVEFTKYYGSAALIKLQELHTQVQKIKI